MNATSILLKNRLRKCQFAFSSRIFQREIFCFLDVIFVTLESRSYDHPPMTYYHLSTRFNHWMLSLPGCIFWMVTRPHRRPHGVTTALNDAFSAQMLEGKERKRTMALQSEAGSGITPKVYSVESMPDYWIAEGTDGALYKVPSEPGGWMRRDVYQGQTESLKPIPPHQARTSVWFTYGDIGTVKIAEG